MKHCISFFIPLLKPVVVYQTTMIDTLTAYQNILVWISGFSLFFFLFSLAAVPWLIARIPENYFLDLASGKSRIHCHRQHIVTVILKNFAGLLLIFMGGIMLFIPGQGLLTILIGLMLVDFPGKTGMVIFLARKKGIQKAMNWIRDKKGSAPLRFPL